MQCYRLIEYVYGEPLPSARPGGSPHDHLIGEVIPPGTVAHIGDKLLQMAAANSTGGGHKNTRHCHCHCHVRVGPEKTYEVSFNGALELDTVSESCMH